MLAYSAGSVSYDKCKITFNKQCRKNNDSKLSNAAAISLFRHAACSTSVSIHSKTRYTGYTEIPKPPISSSSSPPPLPPLLLLLLLLILLLLPLLMVYLKLDKHTHLYFSIKRFLPLPCMILGQQNHCRIPLSRERQGFMSIFVYL